MLEIAVAYHAAGLCVLPAIKAKKMPALSSWRQFQRRMPTAEEVRQWFQAETACCIVCGEVSGRLEMIDFDDDGSIFAAWMDLIPPELSSRLVVELSPSGGRHVVYRHAGAVSGNAKLATKRTVVESAAPVVVRGKSYTPRRLNGRYELVQTVIETRGEGGLFLCSPTEGYEIECGDLALPPTLTTGEREKLFAAAKALDTPSAVPEPPRHAIKQFVAPTIVGSDENRPGDDFNIRGDVRSLLEQHGWTLVRGGDNEQWRRPGKTDGASATLKNGVLFVFSSNAPPFEPQTAYGPFQIYATLEHGGDFAAASRALRELGFGGEMRPAHCGADLTALLGQRGYVEPEPLPKAPAPRLDAFPAHLLDVPGFVGEVAAFNLATAHRQQPILALAGALALQAVLAARKIQDERGNRTNLYIVGIAASGSGKDHSRFINRNILMESGLIDLEGPEDLASDAGLVASLELKPGILLQLDEFGRLLKTIGDPRRAPHLFNLLTVLMKLYSSAKTVYQGKAYGDRKRNKIIDQPCACVYGTSVPEHFYQSLTSDSMQDGFVSRLLIFEADDTPARRIPPMLDTPASILEAARQWGAFSPGGNLQEEHPKPIVAPYSAAARAIFDDYGAHVDERMAHDPFGRAIWARAEEKACRLALIYAASASGPGELVVGEDAVQWACELAEHLTRRLILQGERWVADGHVDEVQKRIVRIIASAGGKMSQKELTRATRWLSKRERDDVFANMLETGLMFMVERSTGGRKAVDFVLGGSAAEHLDT